MTESNIELSEIEQELLNSISIEKIRCQNLLVEKNGNVHIQKISKLISNYLDCLSKEVKVVCENDSEKTGYSHNEGRFTRNQNLDRMYSEIEDTLNLIKTLN